ncbi:MAG: tetratricopeptide repeat protein [PVC group bacterium]|nr:tetratricopeptide repeat protein [PVC group bacterium]
MKKMILIVIGFLLMVLCLTTAGNAESADGLFFEANKYYADGMYEKSAELYEKMISLEIESGNLYYNLGNAYFKLGYKGKALLNYERAKKMIPQDEDLFANAAFVESLLDEKQPQEALAWHEKIFAMIRDMFSARGWFAVCLSFFLAGCIVFGVGLFHVVLRKRARTISVLLAVCFCLSLVFFAQQYNLQKQRKMGVVVVSQTAVRYSPSYSGAVAFELSEGMKAQILRRDGEWSQVRLTRTTSGWVESEAIEPL